MMNSESCCSQQTKSYLISWTFLWLVAMHYFQPNAGGDGLHLAFNNTSWIAISLIVATTLWHISRTRILAIQRSDFILMSALALMALPLLWSAGPWVSQAFDRYLAILALILLILSFRQFSWDDTAMGWMWRLIVVAGIIQATICVIQFYFASEFWFIKNHRPFGTLQQVNVTASFLACTTALAYWRFTIENNRLYRALMILMAFLAGACQFWISSRTGMIASVVSIVAITALVNITNVRSMLMATLFGLALAYSSQGLLGSEVRQNISEPGYRLTQYTLSWEMIKSKPFTGVGLGQFQAQFLEAQAQHYATTNDLRVWEISSSHPHNELLYWGVEGGILPIVVLLTIALWLTWRAWRHPQKERKIIWLCSFPLLLHMQTEYPLYHSVPHLALLALFIATITADNNAQKLTISGITLKPLATAIVLLTTLFMATNLHTTYVLGVYGKSKDVSVLANVINPFGQPTVVNALKCEALLKVGTPKALALAEEIAANEIRLRPTQGYYRLLYTAQALANKKAEAGQTWNRAQYLFPTSSLFAEKAPHLRRASN